MTTAEFTPAQPRTYSNRRYLDAIEDHVVIFDGAMGTSIQKYNLTADDFGGERLEGCNDYLVITRPDVIQAIHESFLAVGSEVVETDTFRGNRLTLGEYGLGDRVLEINRAAAQIARKACDIWEEKTGVPRFVAGSIGPSGKLPSGDDPDLSNITFDELADIFYQQAQGLVEGGADLLLVETSQDILEVKAAIYGINRYFEDSGSRVPLQVQVTLDVSGRMLFGTDVGSALTTLAPLPIDVIGINCSTGPEYMRAPLQYLAEHSPFPISVLPNAGLPINVDGEAVYPMEPDPFSDLVSEFTKWGINIVGGCCGTTPQHLDKLYQKVNGHPHSDLVDGKAQRKHPVVREIDFQPQASSGMTATPLINDPAPTLIGERVNSQGSRKVKRLLLADDYDSIVQIAVDQVNSGAHMLDVCVALTERDDERIQMEKLVKKLSMAITVPLIIDTTEAEVAEAALSLYPGRAVINGNNLENGRDRIDRILPIARKHGSAVLSMTIDEEGMAHTREKKLEIARRITDIAVKEYGMKPEDLIFDVLTFPLTTGQAELRQDAIETIEGIRLIKEHIPGVKTALGVSNVSFGMGTAARGVLNSVFLYQAVRAGLDMAIVNPAHITPYSEIPEDQRKVADDLIFNSDEDALPRFIQYFEQNEVAVGGKEVEDPTKDMTSEEAVHWQIVHRKKEGLEALIDDCLTRQDAVGVLNNVLLPAMKEVGDKFGAGELILPFVLQSAEAMKKSVAYLEQFMDKVEGSTKGTVVLATVYGDVHDIGKNLVKTILSNNGYTVHDIGKQVPANTIIEKAVEYKADAIGLSALLVSTSKQMPLIVNELARRNLNFPVLIGGAAINRKFGRRILFLDESNEPYEPGVFYCQDAFEGLDTMDKLMGGDREVVLQTLLDDAYAEMGKPKPKRRSRGPKAHKTVSLAPQLPKPPFWGAKTVTNIPLEIVQQHVDKPELYRLSWGAKNKQGEEWARIQAEYDARFEQMTQQAIQDGTLNPAAVYGYFPVNADGDDLIVWDVDAYEKEGKLLEVARFSFPRQPAGEYLCISDYYEPVDGRGVDVVQLQAVTVGAAADKKFEKLQGADNYSEAYFFHGLAVQMAEGVANYMTHLVRGQLGLTARQGKRYSWGYPACPDLDDHALVWKLMPEIEQNIGISLTESFQLVPEQSTAAIFAHHPDAKYYAVGSLDRSEQILGS
ncbi:methionine synthase [Phototrophicus methaneseepsis]|uniref:Methionine synthase n=1 Tax=Phototrophicus methaneseepsis TaxID=2710758 RepID=A0A7S8E9H0_9CHLR|nr:methionine synthase [Phototrophicus methaneseepsis]QPC82733.1 methionine synthase [Phototrophicus methaneseepsis]